MSSTRLRIPFNLFATLKAVVAITVCVIAIMLIYRELETLHWADIRTSLRAIPSTALIACGLLAALNYVILIGYDLLAVRILGHKLALRRIAIASFTGFVASNNFGALFGGTPVRARLYSAWGFTAAEMAHLIVLVGATFWLGLFALSGVVFLLFPFPIPPSLNLPFESVRPLGLILALVAVAVIVVSGIRRRPIQLGGYEFTLPAPRILCLQLLVATCDFLVAAGCLYVLMPSNLTMSYPQFLGVFLLGMVSIVITNVPGGVGVFEAVILTFCGTDAHQGVAAALLVFRVIYFLCPLAVALLMIMGHELRPHLPKIQKFSQSATDALGGIVPRFLAFGVMVIGAVLLFSGATPPISDRLHVLRMFLPIEAVELSHFLSSLAGGGLLLLGRGLLRRLDGAWWGAILLLAAGFIFSLSKGLDYEEAAGSFFLLVLLLISRKEFYRRGSILHPSWTAGWISAVTIVVVCTFGLAIFVHQHVEYSHELWWKFAFDEDAPRSLRAQVAVMAMLLGFAGIKLFGAASVTQDHDATQEELELAQKIIQTSSRTSANLALLGDKAFLFNEAKTAFLMYAVQNRSWTVMGDPVGEREAWPELLWEFREHCDKYDAWPVFYHIAPENIPLYIDQGFVLLKLGEEARVETAKFSLAGNRRQSMRSNFNKFRKEGSEFSVVPPEQVRELLPQLRKVSDAWLADKQGAEKGFSLGYFDEDYLTRFPCAIMRYQGEIVGFANLWLGPDHDEFSIDLMRHLDTPKRMMDYLFVELILWGQSQGYRWFNMGMAPLAGIESHELSPTWNKMAALLFKHGDRFYSFEGLRAYKDKFDPVWSPRYLAAPGGLILPRILADVTRLIGRVRD